VVALFGRVAWGNLPGHVVGWDGGNQLCDWEIGAAVDAVVPNQVSAADLPPRLRSLASGLVRGDVSASVIRTEAVGDSHLATPMTGRARRRRGKLSRGDRLRPVLRLRYATSRGPGCLSQR